MDVRVRVRGIYSTALTKILLDEGFEVSHASKVIRDRFDMEEKTEPPTVTIKDTDQKHAIVIVGEYEHGKKVYEVVRNYAIAEWVSKLPLHAIVKGRVVKVENGRSVLDLNGYRGMLNEELEVGAEVLVDVARPFMPKDDLAELSRNYTVYGKYVALIKGVDRKVLFSRHITSKKLKDELLCISNVSNVEGWSIKWRSSAVLGKIDEMLKDVRETYEKAEEILKKGESAKPGEIVYEGEFFAILYLDKDALDDVRGKVVPTVKHHHSLKSVDETEIVEFCEFLMGKGVNVGDIRDYVLQKMREQNVVEIEHITLDGKILRLTPGKPIDEHRIKRVFKKVGVFDGLNVEKSPGDYDLMEFLPDVPLIMHRYYDREGKLKGIYVNLNTPPDISRNKIRYLDMEVDVVAKDGEVRIIDEEKLEEACKLGIIGKETKERYLSLAESVKDLLESHDIESVTIHDLKNVTQSL